MWSLLCQQEKSKQTHGRQTNRYDNIPAGLQPVELVKQAFVLQHNSAEEEQQRFTNKFSNYFAGTSESLLLVSLNEH